jgi:hypothetical protein
MDVVVVALSGVVLSTFLSFLPWGQWAFVPAACFALVASLVPLVLLGPGFQVWRSRVEYLSVSQEHIIDRLQPPGILDTPLLAIATAVDEARVHLGAMNFVGNIPFALWGRRKITIVVAVVTACALAFAVLGLVQGVDLGQGDARLGNWLLALGALGIVVLGFTGAMAVFSAVTTVLVLLTGMVVVSKVTMGSPWGFGIDWFLDHVLVDVRGGHVPPCRGNVTTSQFQLPGGAARLRTSGLRHTRLCYDDGVAQHLISWTQALL